MKIFFKSNSLAKQIASPSQILPSRTPTNEFPLNAATVVIENINQSKPSFRIYFKGEKSPSGAYPIYTCVAEQHSFSTHNGEYITYFGQNSNIFLDKLPEMYSMIKKIQVAIVDRKPLDNN